MLRYICKYLKINELIASFFRYTLLVICRPHDLHMFAYVKLQLTNEMTFKYQVLSLKKLRHGKAHLQKFT